MSVNKVILVGHLGADPETRTTGGGTVVANLRLATSERVKQGDQWADHTEWHRVVAFGRTAENVARYLKKGRQIYVEGKIRTKKYTDKEGQEKYSTEIIADQIHFLGSGPGREGGGGGGREGGGGGGGGQTPDHGNYGGGGGGGGDEDIPF
jgi:single-strand DNA-binding protein